MKAHLDWHRTLLGRALLFVGSLRLAIPAMVLAAAAMVWGTYVDSTEGAKAAAHVVYGAGWFIALMALICLSLIAAVITRFPWRRKHIGFITVHTGLIILIVGSFWSLFGRIEGQIRVQEGQSADAIELDVQQLDLLRPGQGGPTVVAGTSAEDHVRGTLDLDGVSVEIVDRWANCTQEPYVANDAPTPMRAFEVAFGGAEGMWIGESSKSGGPAFVGGMTVRVLGPGEAWEAPAAGATASGYRFSSAGQTHDLGVEGDAAVPGWTIEHIQRFESAQVASGGLSENPEGGDNPAVDVVITDGRGTRERHTAFRKFPDMVLKRTLEGTGDSGAELKWSGGGGERLVLFGEDGSLRAAHIGVTGSVTEHEHNGSFPWAIEVGGRFVRVLEHRTHARQTTRFVEIPPADQFRPAVVVRVNGSDPEPLAWKSTLMVPGGSGFLRYGPRRVELPFALRLVDFRKTDYPGTMMAMAYESDVVVDSPEHDGHEMTIFMNNPFAYEDWKVYQSGFLGDNISIFSVMRDPGLPMTYLGCIVLCVGILMTFYLRAFSRGHPGIGFQPKQARSGATSPAIAREPASSGAAFVRPPAEAGRRPNTGARPPSTPQLKGALS
jgi:hypothetical protein